MTGTSRALLLASLLLAITGCSAAHEPALEPAPPVWLPSLEVLSPVSVAPAPMTGLDACLTRGGELIEVGAVDNNDVRDHGALLTFGISPSGLLAAAGADGTLKFWSFDAELLATVDGSALTYGSEIGAVPITDLAFDAAGAIAGDVRGLVQSMGADGSFQVLGGTTPDVPIIAVAYDPSAQRLAHAQDVDGAPLVVRGADGTFEISDTIATIRDLAFAADGTLVVAGGGASGAAIELRGADDVRAVRAILTLASAAPITEIATAREGAIGVAVSPAGLSVWSGMALAREVPTSEPLSSIDLTPSGAFALSIAAGGALVAHGTSDGREVARVAVDAPLQVRVDPTGQRIVVGSVDAILHVFACVE